jgi:carboxyvinyl-carboxyphosphonate phosphorylmutase
MSSARERFRDLLVRPTCTLAANIFDPLSARIAHLLDYEVCFLSGSVGKAANLGVPDMVLSNMSDLVDHCRRITRIADVSLMVDGEDGFGNAVNVARTVRELEAAGVAAIEIEDNIAPVRFNGEDRGLVSQEEQVGKLKAAVAARTDPTTVIVARTAALAYCALDEALDRMKAYAQTGAEIIRLDVHFVSSSPVERHARAGGHPVPTALVSWIPACAGMTRGHQDWWCIYETDI